MNKPIFSSLLFLATLNSTAQFTRQDTLRGSIGEGRKWWDVQYYNLEIRPDYTSRTISGVNTIGFTIFKDGKHKIMQIDLQEPMKIDSINSLSSPIKKYWRDGNVYFIDFGEKQFTCNKENSDVRQVYAITVFFHGKPVEARRPPWDGGWIWQKDVKKRPWMSVACQGLGASAWFPCKDHQYDEPDLGTTLNIIIPDTLKAVGNGKLIETGAPMANSFNWKWEVKNPINSYNIIPYIGKYVHWKEEFNGEKGKLDCSYWVLDYNLEKAKEQFKQASMTLKAFEHWFGPYPFYEDGFKLVESPHLGMEHQSAVAYGNEFKNGYRGRDLSGTGWGLKWDFIIVHETGHEWFGNNITSTDIADMWIHEGFTNYSETLFTDFHFGKKAGNEYCMGTRKLIQNDMPIIGPYGVNREGSSDMYYKGGNLIHTIRQLINDDERFRQILRGLNSTFWHKTITTAELEKYISEQSGIDLSKVFDQYLRTTRIPVLEFKLSGTSLSFRWTNVIDDFDMRVRLQDGNWLHPSTNWQELPLKNNWKKGIKIDENFYIKVTELKP